MTETHPLISHATLIYIGFSGEKATELWNQWVNWPPGGPVREVDPDDGALQMTFIHFITGVFDGQTDTCSEDDDEWLKCMDSYGMSTEFQRAVMDPVFRCLRLGESCSYWARDTVEMRYAGLKGRCQ